ncbi:MAG: hypothetical protein SGCHY_003998 [Lobulomycetales sp.]
MKLFILFSGHALLASALSVKSYHGSATFYGDVTDEAKGEYNPFNEKQLGACGPPKGHLPIGAEKYFVALNGPQFDPYTPPGNTWGNTLCGSCILVKKGGKSVTAYLTDTCPSCSYGAVDLSVSAFSQLVGGYDQAYHIGLMDVEWEYVSCPEVLNPEVTGGKQVERPLVPNPQAKEEPQAKSTPASIYTSKPLHESTTTSPAASVSEVPEEIYEEPPRDAYEARSKAGKALPGLLMFLVLPLVIL